MSGLTPEEAVERARQALNLEPLLEGRAWPVYPINGNDPSYFLVVLGPQSAAIAVAAIDADTAELQTSVRLNDTGPHLLISAEDAARRTELRSPSRPRLVWTPTRQSRSPLYPLWEVRQEAEIAYVDQQGTVWRYLEAGGPGGG